MDMIEKQLIDAQKQVDLINHKRAEAIQTRNHLIKHARQSGYTWDRIQAATGLSRQALAKILQQKQ